VGRSLAFLLVQAPLVLLATAAYATAGCVAALADRSGRATREIGGAWSRALLRLFRVGVRVSGLEHAPAGPAVYAANHASALDIFVVFGHLPVDFRIAYEKWLSLVPSACRPEGLQ
jgi:1-acyl-sn-glycerol-3-phosphate acyltransferase